MFHAIAGSRTPLEVTDESDLELPAISVESRPSGCRRGSMPKGVRDVACREYPVHNLTSAWIQIGANGNIANKLVSAVLRSRRSADPFVGACTLNERPASGPSRTVNASAEECAPRRHVQIGRFRMTSARVGGRALRVLDR